MASRHPLAGLKRFLRWRALLVYTHRWLGIVGCLLFVVGLIARLLTAPLTMPRGELPGAWAGVATPLMKAK